MNKYYKKKLSRKMNKWLSLILVVTLLMVIFITSYDIKDRENERLVDLNKILINAYSNKSAMLIENAFKNIEAIANQIDGYASLGDLNEKDIERIVLPVLEAYTDYKGLLVLLRQDDDILNPYWYYEEGSIYFEEVDNYNDSLYWQTVAHTPRGLIEPQGYIVGDEEMLLTTLLVPVHEDQKVVGMVGLDLELDFFQVLTEEMDDKRDLEVSIITDEGFVVSHTNIDKVGIKVSQSLKGKDIQEVIKSFVNINNDQLVMVTAIDMGFGDKEWYISINIPKTSISRYIIDSSKHILITAIMCLLFLMVFDGIVVKRLLRPIKQIHDTLTKAASGDLSVRTDISSKDEIESIGNGLNELLASLQEHRSKLENEIILNEDLNGELEDLMKENDRIYFDTIKSLVRTIEAKDEYTAGHCDRVTHLACLIGDKLDFNQKEMTQLTYGAILHDIGKIAIEDSILLKNKKLSNNEYDIIKKHPLKGVEIISDVQFLQLAQPVILQHHERYDGKGYPAKLSGININLNARIVAITDAYDAMTSSRSYRRALSKQAAMDELIKNKGLQFDPELVDLFIDILNSIEEVSVKPA